MFVLCCYEGRSSRTPAYIMLPRARYRGMVLKMVGDEGVVEKRTLQQLNLPDRAADVLSFVLVVVGEVDVGKMIFVLNESTTRTQA